MHFTNWFLISQTSVIFDKKWLLDVNTSFVKPDASPNQFIKFFMVGKESMSGL